MNIIGENFILLRREGNPKINATFALRRSATLVLLHDTTRIERNLRKEVPILVRFVPNAIGRLNPIMNVAVIVWNLKYSHYYIPIVFIIAFHVLASVAKSYKCYFAK